MYPLGFEGYTLSYTQIFFMLFAAMAIGMIIMLLIDELYNKIVDWILKGNPDNDFYKR